MNIRFSPLLRLTFKSAFLILLIFLILSGCEGDIFRDLPKANDSAVTVTVNPTAYFYDGNDVLVDTQTDVTSVVMPQLPNGLVVVWREGDRNGTRRRIGDNVSLSADTGFYAVELDDSWIRIVDETNSTDYLDSYGLRNIGFRRIDQGGSNKYILMRDIDVGGESGNQGNTDPTLNDFRYNSILDGNGATIKSGYRALFGMMAETATIKNLRVEMNATSFDPASSWGGIGIGPIASTLRDDSIIDSCSSTGTLVLNSSNANSQLGGLVSSMLMNSSIINSYSDMNMTANTSPPNFNVYDVAIGGLVGTVTAGRIVNSYASGTLVNNNTPTPTILGGLVGTLISSAAYIDHSVAANLTLTAPPANSGTIGRLYGNNGGASPIVTDSMAQDNMTVTCNDISYCTDPYSPSGGPHDNPSSKNGGNKNTRDKATYEALGWDFTTTWIWDNATSLPRLR